jgi:hypothetical protein
MAAEQDAAAQTGGSDPSTAYALTPLAGTRSSTRHDTRHGTIGLYYDRAERPNQQNIPFSSQWLAAYGNPAAFFGNAFNGYNTLFYGTNTATNTERSVFGQGTYHITDKLSATTNRRLVSRVSAAVSP